MSTYSIKLPPCLIWVTPNLGGRYAQPVVILSPLGVTRFTADSGRHVSPIPPLLSLLTPLPALSRPHLGCCSSISFRAVCRVAAGRHPAEINTRSAGRLSPLLSAPVGVWGALCRRLVAWQLAERETAEAVGKGITRQ